MCSWLLEGSTTMAGNSEYECGECRHRFRAPEGVPRDTRTLMCPACGSIDLNLMSVERPQPVVMVPRAVTPSPLWREPRETKAS
jgi:DNA-directed RNA polymerase subunit RPC12/RpoP